MDSLTNYNLDIVLARVMSYSSPKEKEFDRFLLEITEPGIYREKTPTPKDKVGIVIAEDGELFYYTVGHETILQHGDDFREVVDLERNTELAKLIFETYILTMDPVERLCAYEREKLLQRIVSYSSPEEKVASRELLKITEPGVYREEDEVFFVIGAGEDKLFYTAGLEGLYQHGDDFTESVCLEHEPELSELILKNYILTL